MSTIFTPVPIPSAQQKFPLPGYEKLCFLNQVVNHPQISIGDYTYYDDFEDVDNFLKNVRYLFEFNKDRLIIGKYCMIASGVSFLMNGGNHLANSLTVYPFAIFGGDWSAAMAGKSYPNRGDTTIGSDVWIGHRAMLLPGITVGHGAIIGAGSVVTKDVEPYSIVGGNPAVTIRKRFDATTIAALLDLAWWNWSVDRITRNVQALTGGDITKLVA